MPRTRSPSRRRRLRAMSLLAALLVLELLLVGALHALAAVPGLAGPAGHPAGWSGWLRATPPTDVVAALLRLLALGCAWWLLAATVLTILGALARWRPTRDVAAVLTPPAVRRLVDRALAGALAASVALGPASSAAAAPASRAPAATVVDVASAGPPAALPPVWQVRPPGDPSGSAAERPAPSALSEDREHVVQPGEHLWAVAEHTVRADRPDADERDVASYWLAVVQANRARLRSDDPDLVFPGERIVLPARPAER